MKVQCNLYTERQARNQLKAAGIGLGLGLGYRYSKYCEWGSWVSGGGVELKLHGRFILGKGDM